MTHSPSLALVAAVDRQPEFPHDTWYPRDRCLTDLFGEQAARTPGAVAVEHRGDRLTFQQLQTRVDQLARHLVARRVVPRMRVGLCLDRSADLVVALLAILKTGAAYVPLDPGYPASRVRFILQDADISVLVTQQSLFDLSSGTAATRVALDREGAAIARQDAAPLASAAAPGDVAYVIYTSGSTGTPKGVQVTNRNLVNFLWSMRREPGLTCRDIVPAITTISFDIAALEIFLPLIIGARVVVIDRHVASDGRLLCDVLAGLGVSMVQATPATWRLLLAAGWQGDPGLKVLSGGEALPRDLADALLERAGSVWNMYGPTETTVWSTAHCVTSGSGPVPIGRPIANTRIYLLDEQRNPVAGNAVGEIHIGGDGVALGYLNRPELTAQRFVPDPFDAEPGRRMYRTGDFGRRTPAGDIVFAGRADHQVKIRGYRIEPEEIEAVLAGHPHVSHAVVVAVDDPSGEKRLVSYYCTPDANPRPSHDLRRFLKDRLPEYMVPSIFAHLQALPLTPNGKVDRKALPAAAPAARERVIAAPRDDVERQLVALWEQALEVAPIGITDNFFDLGGHSLLALRLFADIGRRFGRDLPLSTLIDAPTIEQLAGHVRRDADAARWHTLVAIQPAATRRPLFVVHGGGGTVLFLRDLARHLGIERPLYGLQCEGLDGRRATRISVEQMATHYVSAIRSVQPAGPFLLSGYCFGGLVAFEMAQQLRAAGEQVDILALFNAPNRAVPPDAIENRRPPTPRSVAMRRHLRALKPLPVAGRIGYLGETVRSALAWRRSAMNDALVNARQRCRELTCEVYLAARRVVPQRLRDAYVFRLTTSAEEHYVPQKYPGHLVVFRGNGLYKDPTLGWSRFADSVETIEVGTPQRLRRELVREPVVQLLARELRARLDRLPDSSEAGASAA